MDIILVNPKIDFVTECPTIIQGNSLIFDTTKYFARVDLFIDFFPFRFFRFFGRSGRVDYRLTSYISDSESLAPDHMFSNLDGT